MSPGIRKFWQLAGLFAAIYVSIRYLLPLVSPFVLGALLALAAEPLVGFFCRKCRSPRPLSSALGVSMAFSLLALVCMLVLGFLIREVRVLTGMLPDLTDAVRSGMDTLSGWLLGLAQRAPDGLRPMLTRNVTELFSGGSAVLDRAVDFLIRLASGILSRVPGGALSLATGIISSFMISAKLPALRSMLRSRIPADKAKRFRDVLGRLKSVLAGWIKAQAKLSGITFLVAAAGFLLLRIPHAPLWAVLVAIVDAFPILGTGTVLVPWSILSFAQGDPFRAFALLGLYGAATLVRSVLEPRLVGRHLGLDPLVTLIALYTGFRLFGLPGMLLSPMIAVAAVQLVENTHPADSEASD